MSAGSLAPLFTCRVTFSDLVRWRDRRTVGVCSPWARRGRIKCAMICERYVSSVLQLCRETMRLSVEVKQTAEKLFYMLFCRMNWGLLLINWLDLFCVCSEEVSGACRDQTTVEDLVRNDLFSLLLHYPVLHLSFDTLAHTSKVCYSTENVDLTLISLRVWSNKPIQTIKTFKFLYHLVVSCH